MSARRPLRVVCPKCGHPIGRPAQGQVNEKRRAEAGLRALEQAELDGEAAAVRRHLKEVRASITSYRKMQLALAARLTECAKAKHARIREALSLKRHLRKLEAK